MRIKLCRATRASFIFSDMRVHVGSGGPVPRPRIARLFQFFGPGHGIRVPARLQIRKRKLSGAWKRRLEINHGAELLNGGWVITRVVQRDGGVRGNDEREKVASWRACSIWARDSSKRPIRARYSPYQ